MTKKYYTGKYDRVFKTIFCNEDDTKLIEEFISRILNKKVKYIKFLRNELPVNSVYDKLKTVDVLVLVDDEYVHIEINIDANSTYLHNRNFIYFTEIYNNKTKRGEIYDINTKFIHIDISYGLSIKDEDYKEYYVMDARGEKYVKNFKIIEYNMDKIMEYWYNKNIESINKFIHLIILDLKDEDIPERDDFVKKYQERLQKLNEDETFVSAISYEEDLRLQKNTMRYEGYMDGIKEAVKNMLNKNFNDDEIKDILNIDENLLNTIKEELNS